MKRFISFLLFSLLATFALAQPNITGLVQLSSVSATGGGYDYDITAARGFCDATLASYNTAGTNPTLAAKLQTAALDTAGMGAGYITAGATDNKLKAGATTTVQLAATWTQSGARALKQVRLQLKKIGTITAAQTVTVTIQTDSTGAPSGTILGTTTISIDSSITTAYQYVAANFAAPVDVADATAYWVVLSASYTASASNCVCWRTKGSLGSGGNFATFDATNWTADATSSSEWYVERQYLAFADVTGGAAAGATTGASVLNRIGFQQGDLQQFIRWYYTIGGTSSPAYVVASQFYGKYKNSP